MALIARTLDVLTRLLVLIGGVAIALMSVHIVADVVGRYLFRAPLPGTVEFVSRYYMVILVFLPLAYVQTRGAHFVAGLFTDALPFRVKQALIAVTELAMTAVAALLAWRGVSAAIYATRNGEQVQAAEFVILTWPGRWLVPIGFSLMAACALLNAVRILAGRSFVQQEAAT
jgi:TRAP-type C4-dicarboxylate transport system permease small subunit